MSLRDRTSEFLSASGTGYGRSTAQDGGLRHRMGVSQAPEYGMTPVQNPSKKTEFSRVAGMIASDIQATTGKLEKLGSLVQRKTLFDDRPVEISELTSVIKRDIASLNGSIMQLSSMSQNFGGVGQQAREHANNVVLSLQERLHQTSQSFAKVLEVRTESMRAAQGRRDTYTPARSVVPRRMQTNSALYQPATPGDADQSLRPDSVSIDFGSQSQQLLLEEETTRQYMGDRNQAMEGIQSTMEELGQIFQQLGSMISQHREQIQRIDVNIEDVDINISGAQRQLLKYYKNLTSNRWLMLKVFAIILFFFIVFTIFL